MDNSNRSRLCAFGLLVAITLGIYLGNSAISAINPAHFRGAATSTFDRGGAVRTDRTEPAPLYGAQYSRAEAMLVRAGVCPGCDSGPSSQVFSYVSLVPYFGSREERAAAEARERRAIDNTYALREQRREAAQARTGIGGPFEPATGLSGAAEAITTPAPGPVADRNPTDERGEQT